MDDLEYKGETAVRSVVVAGLLSVLHPGLGYLYIGRGRSALYAFAFFWVYVAAFVMSWAMVQYFPVLPFIVWSLGWLLLATMCMIGIVRQLSAAKESYIVRGYNHPVFYALVFVLLVLIPLYGAYHVCLEVIWGVVKVNDDTMLPSVLRGDTLLVDRSAYWGALPARGDVVVLRGGTPGSNHVVLGRVIALAGDRVRFQGTRVSVNEVELVRREFKPTSAADAPTFIETNHDKVYMIAGAPAGPPRKREPLLVSEDSLLVLGDNEGPALARDSFQPMPTEQVVGKVRYLLYSETPEGEPRWGRVGVKLR